MGYSWILFDVHGVLDKVTFGKVIQRMAGGSRIDDGKMESYRRWGDMYAEGNMNAGEFWWRMEDEFGEDKSLEARDYFLRMQPEEQLWVALPSLHKKYFMGIVSDSPEEKTAVIRRYLNKNNPSNREKNMKLFDAIYFSSKHRITKTYGGLYRKVLDDFLGATPERGEGRGGDPSRFLVVDDSERNLDEARSLGMSTHLYTDVNSLLNELLPNRKATTGIVG